MTCDEQNIKAILATQFSDYGKGEEFNRNFHDFLGDSIFATDGKLWHDSRQLLRPQFVKDRLADIKIFERHCKELVPLLGGDSEGQIVDAMDLFYRFTLDASTDFLLGRSFNSLHHGETDFGKAFKDIQHYESMIARVGRLKFLIPRGNFDSQLKVLNNYVESYIDDTLSIPPAELEKRSKSDEGYTLLHALANYTRDRTVLRDQLVAVLLAGRDTTDCTLAWLVHEISTKPQVVEKIRAEIMEHVGPTDKPTYENLKAMKYIQVRCPSRTQKKQNERAYRARELSYSYKRSRTILSQIPCLLIYFRYSCLFLELHP